LNLRHPQLRRRELRRAMNKAVDREEIISTVMRGYAIPALDPVWPLHWAYSSRTQQHQFDPALAKAELQQHLPGSDGLRFRCMFYGEDPQFERMALLLQRQLNEVGVQLDLQPATYAEMLQKMKNGDFDSMLMLFASGRALDWTYRFWHSPIPGHEALQSTAYTGADAILDDLRVAFTDQDVRNGVERLRQRFYDDPPAVFIAWQQVTRAVSSRFDLSDADKEDAFANIWQWKPAAKRQ
jgi:ABC-type transport system substrate-binding protein